MKTYVIFFDGVCNLCNSTIQFIIKHDKRKQFKFSSLQSDYGQNFLNKRGLSSTNFDSIIVHEPDIAYYTKSTAALKIAQIIGFPYNLLSVFFLLPSSIRDFFYTLIAKNRYLLLGKKESCMVPTPDLKKRFLK